MRPQGKDSFLFVTILARGAPGHTDGVLFRLLQAKEGSGSRLVSPLMDIAEASGV